MATLLLSLLNVQPKNPLNILRSRGTVLEKRTKDDRMAAAKQPRGGRGRRLLPDFERFISIKFKAKPGYLRLKPGYEWKYIYIYIYIFE